jgi:phosphoglycolate phosphatase
VTWNTVLFDLDGTLTESGQGVANGVLHALAAFDLPAPSADELRKYLGPPLWVSFDEYAGLKGADIERAVHIYREYYHDKGRFENAVYPGIPEMLDALVDSGVRIAVATSKVDHSAVSILEHFDLDKYFEVISGSDELGVSRGTKALVIAHALSELKVQDNQGIVMIGDREHDIHGAKEHQLESIGVLWGYGDEVELSTAGAGHIVASVSELHGLLIPNAS